MASQTTACFPSSFQLRFAFQCRRPGIFNLRTSVRKLDRQIRVRSLHQEGAQDQNSNGVERRDDSWVSLNPSTDSVAGWSNYNDSGPSPEYERKLWLTEILGKTIAGVIFFTGLTFMTLSFSRRHNSRPKQHMEHLTSQNEVLLASESMCNGSVDTGNEYDNHESNAAINLDSSLFPKPAKSSLEEDGGVVGVSGINDASVQEDLQYKLAADDILVSPDTSPESLKLSERGSDADIAAGDSMANMNSFNVNDSTVFGGSMGGEPTETSLNSTSSVDRISDEALSVNVSAHPKEDAGLEPHILSNDEINVSTPDAELETVPEVSVEENIKALEMHNILESVPSDMTSVAAQLPLNEQTTTSEDEIHGNRKSYDATNPQDAFSSIGFPAPSIVSTALQMLPGKVLVPAAVDQTQCQALAALQALKVIESDRQPGDLCTRREYARWLVSASSALSRSMVSKVYPAMYIENVTDLAFDDVTSEDPDFSSIQGLAESGLISSKLSRRDMLHCSYEGENYYFSPDSPLSRQDLVSWKLALERKHLPEADRKILQQISGFLDIDKINLDAWPAVMADVSAGESGITALAFGYTKLFQPNKPVTKAQAAIALATGEAADTVSEELARMEAESMAENAISAHSTLVDQVEKDLNAIFEKELSMEREKILAMEKLAEEAREELDRLRTHRDEESVALMREHAAVDSEMEVLSRLRQEVEENLRSLMMNKVEVSYEKERITQLRRDAENENQEIERLHYELDVERKALSMARAWAEDEAKRAREQARALDEARERWQRHGIKVVVGKDFQDEASPGATWINAGKPFSIEGTMSRAENLVDNLRAMAANVGGKSKDIINGVIVRMVLLQCSLRDWTCHSFKQAGELKNAAVLKVRGSAGGFQHGAMELSWSLREGAKRVAGDCREGVEKFTQKFKMG